MGVELISLFIPVIAIICMAIFFKNHMVWWEYVLLIIVPVIFILLLHKIFVVNLTSDTKYKDTYVTRIEYYEEWNEYIHRTCSRTVSCGKNCTRTVYYDCSYVRYHPEKFEAVDNTKYVFSISKKEYIEYKKILETKEIFKDLNRNYHTIDGDMYYVNYDNNINKLISLTRKISYENRTQASKNLFKFEEITEEEKIKYGLFDYPDIVNNKQFSVLGKNITKEENSKIEVINSVLGSKLNLKVFVLYFKNANIDIAHKQRSYWNGGNNNEFIICISEDENGNQQWIKTFSWMNTPTLEKIIESNLRNEDKITINKIYNQLVRNVEKNWSYNDFSQFEYIEVEITKNQLILLYILMMLLTTGLCYWVYVNEFDNGYKFEQKKKNVQKLKNEFKRYRRY